MNHLLLLLFFWSGCVEVHCASPWHIAAEAGRNMGIVQDEGVTIDVRDMVAWGNSGRAYFVVVESGCKQAA